MGRAQYDVNFFDPAFVADPYGIYEEIRAAGRIVWNGTLGIWMVPGFEDAMAVLADQGRRFAELNSDPELIFWFDAPNMIMVDGAEHQRLRHCLAPLFTRSATARWEPRVNAVVDELLAPLVDASKEFELADFTMIPTVIVAEMLGVPQERHGDFRRWSHDITSNLAYGHEGGEARAVMERASKEVNDYITEEITRHRAEDLDDLLGVLLKMDDVMTDAEIRSAALLLLLAGFDTTAKLMSNCLVVLEQHPDQRRMVVEDPSLVAGAVEEVLRYDGPAQVTPRQVVTDCVFAGQELKTGDKVDVLHGAANRDAARWTDPQRFDVRREPKMNIGFGYGPHLCLGAPLARLETKVAIERLLRVAPEYHLRDLDYGRGFFARGPERGVIEARVSPPT